MNAYAFNNLFVGTAQKKYIKSAFEELKNLDPDLKIIDRYPDGIFTFRISIHKEVFLFKLMEVSPIFLRHLHPIDRMFFIPHDSDVPKMASHSVLNLSDKIIRGKRIAVQARRIPADYDYTLFSIKKEIDPVLIENFSAVPVVKKPNQVVSIYIADYSEIDYRESATCAELCCSDGYNKAWKGVCFMGISAPEENLCEWSGGEVRFSKEDEQVSRAEFKLLEAFEIFHIEPRPQGLALDLGASPGGWTRILHKKGYRINCVDKAPVDKDILSLKGVNFIKKDAMHFRDNPEVYDIITNDINRDPIQSAKAMLSVAPSLKMNSPFIMTIKLPGKSSMKIINKVLETLECEFDIKGNRQLYHNRDETTIWGTRKSKG